MQWSYGRILNSCETSNSQELLSITDGRIDRNPMLRGFSQEVCTFEIKLIKLTLKLMKIIENRQINNHLLFTIVTVHLIRSIS